ncbi:UDP-glucose 4-epimerase GalE [Capnocytophaga sp. ARDL2]|uniref:UDP-glucose 4-epimerase GalE n=1 Tax=Capnocytophaga sp. ARDL2 TaxID=3238809 RepID=UPI0035572681
MKILITGGLGFIGSHTVVSLVENGFTPIIIDNCSNSSEEVLMQIETIIGKPLTFYKEDVTDGLALDRIFTTEKDIKGVIHFAAAKAVGESVENPLKYYHNNITGLVQLLTIMQNHQVNNMIFSSSCTVYGQVEKMPITEDAPVQAPISPYGNTKKVGEEIIQDVAKSSDLQAILLRYFNPIGAHPSALIGELPLGVPQNLLPFITQTAVGIREKLSVFGSDYPTPDGTCIRDYIHVLDLADAHVIALKRLMNQQQESNIEIYNIGTGKGTSVLEMITAFEEVTQQSLPYEMAPRREGDTTIAFADTTLVNEKLGWKAQRTLEESLDSAWKWQLNISNKTL